MPKKTIKEMSAWERRHFSLQAKTFHAVLVGALILGIVALITGLGLYVYSLSHEYVQSAFELTKNASNVMGNVVDVSSSCRKTIDIYQSIPEEDREVQDEEYFKKFTEVTEGPNYGTIMEVLRDFKGNSGVNDIFIGIYNREDNHLIYVADPDTNRPCPTGTWEEVRRKEVDKFLGWNGKGIPYEVTYTEKYGWLCTTGTPVYAKDGSISGFVLADVSMTEFLHGMRNFVLQYIIATAITVFLLGFFLSNHIRKEMVEPINSIAGAAVEYAKDKRSGTSGQTRHFEDLGIETGDEIENLYLTLSDMERDLAEYEENLTNAVKEKERIGTELHLATRIQEDMLPNIFPPFPNRKDFDIYATMIPAKEVGGDFYDYFLIDDDHICMVIADVSGKGVPAALFMMASKILIKTTALSGIMSPAEILERVNAQICDHNSQEMFVTVWLGILELSTGKLTAANAGHEYPVIRQGKGKYELFKDKHGFVVGGMDGIKYHDYEMMIEPGSMIFVYTDGVTEATSENMELFGTERMLDVLNSAEIKTAKEVLGTVKKSVNSFVGKAPQFDDITMLCFNYIGTQADKPGYRMEGKFMKEMTLEATVNNIPEVTDFVNAELEALGCPMKAQMQIDVAIDELFGNIAQYAYDPLTGPATVRVEVDEDPMAVIITFIDNGKPYDPLAGKDPDISLSAEDREIGGLGVFLVKKTMDEITYEYKNGQNILKIRKNM
jgi:sigma-B regulation protein RsbU (phosphoserine phosphatase)